VLQTSTPRSGVLLSEIGLSWFGVETGDGTKTASERPATTTLSGVQKRSSPIELCSCHSCGSAVTENVVMGVVGLVEANSLIHVLA
jgi:hypothetical protein